MRYVFVNFHILSVSHKNKNFEKKGILFEIHPIVKIIIDKVV